MKIDVLSRAKKKKFVEGLSNLGIEKISEMLLKTGKEKARSDRCAVRPSWCSVRPLRCETGFACEMRADARLCKIYGGWI